MSAASVVSRGAGMAGLCVCNVGLQMCTWKVRSLWPKAQQHGTVKAQSSWRHLLYSLLDNTSESKLRDPNRPHCVMEAQPASFHTPPISQRQRHISSGLLPACGLQGDHRNQAHRANAKRIPQHPGSSNPSQHTAAKWPECWRLWLIGHQTFSFPTCSMGVLEPSPRKPCRGRAHCGNTQDKTVSICHRD